MKKFCAVAMTAALALPVLATAAGAQEETITVEGLFFLDRNGDNVFTEGENVRANGPAVRVTVQGTNERVGEFPVGPDGRYKAVLPKGPTYLINNMETDYTATRLTHGTSESLSGADFALRGIFLSGVGYVDANGDGVKQPDEKVPAGKIKVSGKAGSGDVELETEPAADGSYLVDLPLGDFVVTAPDLSKDGLVLAEPKSARDVDWVTRTRAVKYENDADRKAFVDTRYQEARADVAVASTIAPLKDTYVKGEQIDVKLTLTNKGNTPVTPEVVLGSFQAKLVSHSDNVTFQPGTDDVFSTKEKLLPGKQAEVALKVELDNLEYEAVHAVVRFNFGSLPDVDRKNNVVSTKIKVVEKAVETTTPPTTTVPTTTTTTAPAVAQAGNKSGLASTGASPLGFLGLGSLLVAAGVAAFFVARRRRS
ncbi:hypothetical protein JNUCC0626_34435 [Lentzea sp. JNUCC 0626]|uniref:hypothetical protein n=1 Tax=Lentzea sp. JNUCC 0626 TaxID=3367513 RepID=UPI003747E089